MNPFDFTLNAQAAKQMSAMLAVNQARTRGSSLSGTSSGIGFDSTPGTGMNATFNESGMAQSNAAARMQSAGPVAKQRQFLSNLARLMVTRNTPLPPNLTGIETPTFDSNNTVWKFLDVVDVGVVRLAGREVDIPRLWGIIVQAGGGQSVSEKNSWHLVLPHFDLPEEFPFPNGTTSVAQMMAQYYKLILFPVEDMFRANLQNQQRKAQSTRQASGSNAPASATSPQRPGPPLDPQTAVRRLSSASQASTPNAEKDPNGYGPDGGELDAGPKRKHDSEEPDSKRVRQKTEPADTPLNAAETASSATSTGSSMPAPARPRQRPSRRKIEYVPWAREVDTVGGRDLKALETENAALQTRRPIRDINDWGTVAVDALVMSIRSRISTELSYALTTFTLLSTMHGSTPTSGFMIAQSTELLEEILDLLEDQAFTDTPDPALEVLAEPTHRELVNMVVETESEPFACLVAKQGSKDPNIGPRQRPGAIILTITNILKNLSYFPDNATFLSRQERMLDLMLRLCSLVVRQGQVVAASPVLSIADVVTVRKDTLFTLMHLSASIHFTESPTSIDMAERTFRVLSSFLTDPIDAISPSSFIHLTGHTKPALLVDVALDTFSRIVQSDGNRKVVGKAVAGTKVLQLFSSLVHRLPVVDEDFLTLSREQWLSYIERIVMLIYSLAFLASPDVKRSIKEDRTLALQGVLLRMLQKFGATDNLEYRGQLFIFARRATETLKLLDDCEDSFDTSETPGIAPLSFGMGFGESGDSGMERGTGWLGPHRQDTWKLLQLREVQGDAVMFSELESLTRVDWG